MIGHRPQLLILGVLRMEEWTKLKNGKKLYEYLIEMTTFETQNSS